jgi:GTP-binding protein
VAYRDFKSFVVADIPGIIEGAAEGKGLGLRFLRHIERNSVLLFLIPADSQSINREYQILLDELKRYNPQLLDKSRILAVSKCDLLDEELTQELAAEIELDIPVVFISSVTGQGIEQLKDTIWNTLTSI